MIRIAVCMKQVLDPEAPLSAFEIDPEAKRAVPYKGIPPVLNPYDENALEAALRIKDAHDADITVISMGRNLARPVLMKSLAAGADQLILLEDDTFEDLDSYSTAFILSKAIEKTGNYDLILCGRESADTDAGQVGVGIAEILGIPSVTIAQKVQIDGGKVILERVISDGCEVVEAPIPVLITVSSELGELRSITVKAIIEARKKTSIVWEAADIGVDPSQLRQTNLVKLVKPAHESRCEVIKGVTPEEAATNLALKLREAEVI